MKITLDMLKQFNACKAGIAFIKENYPDGADAIEIMKSGKLPLEMLHFAYQFFPIESNEIDLYKQICNIDNNSKSYLYSNDIKNSQYIYHSSKISDSEYINNSSEIYSARDVYNSQLVRGSRDILDSKHIRNSTVVINSNDVSESNEIQYSNHVNWSRYVTESNNADECAYIYKCNKVNDCYCSGFLNNCQHCLFCSDLLDSEYYIFNEKVSPEVYEQWKELLLEQLGAETNKMIEVDYNNHDGKTRYSITTRFDCVFDGLSDTFYGWVGTVPGADDTKFINLFFKDCEFNNE